jgi:hypothetical protein
MRCALRDCPSESSDAPYNLRSEISDLKSFCLAGASARKIPSMHSDGKTSAAHHGHDHGHTHGLGVTEAVSGILGAAVVATLVLVAAELTASYVGHSIALATDAVHNLTDVPTLVISWLAMRPESSRPL